MPLPNRRKGEKTSAFVARCMGDETMKREYRDPKQRAAVCHSQAKKKPRSPAAAVAEPPASGTELFLEATATLQAQPLPEGEKCPKFSMVANTGRNPMAVAGWRYPVLVDFAGLRIPSQVRPIRMNHDRSLGVGHTTAIGYANGELTASGMISRDTEAARDVIASAGKGFPWQASVGAAVNSHEFVKEGESVSVNGLEFRGPLNVIRHSTLGEISFVDLGADDRTSVKVSAMPTKTRSKPKTDDEEELAQAEAEEELAAEAEEDPAAASIASVIESAKRRRSRSSAIAAEVENALSFAGADVKKIEAIATQADAEEWTLQETQIALLRATRPRPPAPRQADLPNGKILEAALAMHCGVSDDFLAKDRDYGEEIVDRAYRHRSLGLRGTIAAALEFNGVRVPHGKTELYATLMSQRWIQAEGGFSTINLPGILGNVANKILLQAFVTVNAVYDRVGDQADFSNFQIHTIYRLDHLGDFQIVPKDGEIKHGSLSQTSFQNKVDTYGQMLTLSRQDIINDDLNAFRTLTAQLARKARIAVEKALFTLIQEATDTFYTVPQGNRLVGALGITELGAAEAALATMADAWGDPIYATPKWLLVPSALHYMAQQIYTSAQVMDFTAGPNKARPTDNPFRGRFEVLTSPYLQLANMAGSSATTWYLLADPLMLPAFQVAYLDGRRAPTIETHDAVFNTLGIMLRCYWDFGVCQLDYRGAIKSTAT